MHAGEGVQRAERLVQQQYLGLVYKGAYKSYALCHTAGKLTGIVVFELLKADDVYHALNLVFVALELALNIQAEGDIVFNGEPGEQGRPLEYHAAVGGGAFYFLAVYRNLAQCGNNKARNKAENG